MVQKVYVIFEERWRHPREGDHLCFKGRYIIQTTKHTSAVFVNIVYFNGLKSAFIAVVILSKDTVQTRKILGKYPDDTTNFLNLDALTIYLFKIFLFLRDYFLKLALCGK